MTTTTTTKWPGSSPWVRGIGQRLRHTQWRLEHGLYQVFYAYGRFVASHATLILLTSVLLSAACTVGLVFFRFVDNPNDEYTPATARSRYELNVLSELRQRQKDTDLAQQSQSQSGNQSVMLYKALQLQVTAADDGDLLNRSLQIQQLNSFIQFVRNEFRETQTGLSQSQMCGSFCELSTEVESFIYLFSNERLRKDVNIQLTFPVISALGKRVFIGSKLYGVSTKDKEVIGAKLAVFSLGSASTDLHLSRTFDRWKTQLQNFVFLGGMQTRFGLLRAALVDNQIVNEEVKRTGVVAMPYLLVTAAVLLVFSVTTSLKSDTIRSKPWLAVLACVVPIMGTLSAFGLLALIGLPFQTICVISMFLALGIGVDDAYLMLHAWHVSHGQVHRMGSTVAVSGPSITITSLTNLISFLIGISSDTPAIRVFCIYTTVTLAYCYVLQLTLFTAAVALDARREHKHMNALLCCVNMPDIKPLTGCMEGAVRRVSVLGDHILVSLSHMYTQSVSAVVLVLCLLLYWSVSVWGILNVQVHISLDVLLLPDSSLWHFFQWDKKYTSVGVQPLTIIVTNPGDLRNQSRLSGMFDVVKHFEHWGKDQDNDIMLGPDTTMFWLKQYVDYLSLFGDTQFTYEDIPRFLTLSSYSVYKFDLDYNETLCVLNEPECVRSFSLTTAFNKPTDWVDTIQFMSDVRAIASAYTEYNTTVHYLQAFLADQVKTLWPTTVRTVLVTLLAMLCVCCVFVPEPMCVLCAMCAVLSINVGVFGLGALWQVHLDMITAVGLLMSIGISVDFTAHVTYHYFKAAAKTNQERVLHALRGCAWPMCQAAVSSVLCALVMSQLGARLLVVFMKIIVLVVLLGVMHGLVVLPIIMAALPFSKPSQNGPPISDNGHPVVVPVTNQKCPADTRDGTTAAGDGPIV